MIKQKSTDSRLETKLAIFIFYRKNNGFRNLDRGVCFQWSVPSVSTTASHIAIFHHHSIHCFLLNQDEVVQTMLLPYKAWTYIHHTRVTGKWCAYNMYTNKWTTTCFFTEQNRTVSLHPKLLFECALMLYNVCSGNDEFSAVWNRFWSQYHMVSLQ